MPDDLYERELSKFKELQMDPVVINARRSSIFKDDTKVISASRVEELVLAAFKKAWYTARKWYE